ncbi:MAG: hypothetical protein QOC92_104, partial [Acidimicrobiaceae bacterium]
LGRTTEYARRADGKVIAKTTPRGVASSNGPQTVSLSDGDHQLRTYFTTVYDYDPSGALKSRSVPFAPGQYDLPDSTLKSWKVTYARDPAGNPSTITDPRGNAITNTFFDTGELRSTTRPSYYDLNWGTNGSQAAPNETKDPGIHFGQQAGAADLEVATGGPSLAERPGRSTNAAGSERVPTLPHSDGQTNFGSVDRQQLGGMLPLAGATTFAYDNEMRLTTITDVAGNARSIGYDAAGRVRYKEWPFKGTDPIRHVYDYDPNGNLASYTACDNAPPDHFTCQGPATTFSYDGYDRRTHEIAPGAGATTTTTSPPPENTTLAYDENGNLTSRVTPRGPAYAFAYRYDSLDRLTSEANPRGDTWTYSYDTAGNRTREGSPRGNLQTMPAGESRGWYDTSYEFDAAERLKKATDGLGHDTNYSYDADGNLTAIDAPGAQTAPGGGNERRVTEMQYDGRGLMSSQTTGSGADKRTTLRTFDPNGNLRRVVNPKGVGASGATDDFSNDVAGNLTAATKHATVRVYNSDDLLTDAYMPWGGTGSGDKRYQQRYGRDTRGRVTALFAPFEVGASAAPQTSYDYLDNGWIASYTDEEMRNPAPPNPPTSVDRVEYDYDKRGEQTKWLTYRHGSYKGRSVTRELWPNGLLKQRTATKVKDDGTADQTTTRTYQYAYNPNRSLTSMQDSRLARTTTFGRDSAERLTQVNETWLDGKDTGFAYDANGNVTSRQTDGRFVGGQYVDSNGGHDDAKTTSFTYDRLDRETQMRVAQGSDPMRTTNKTYYDSGELATQHTSNNVNELRFYGRHGDLTTLRRQRDGAASADFLKDQDYTYDPNGNRTKDERGTHDFNARNQLVHWTRGPNQQNPGSDVTYELNASGAIVKKTDTKLPINQTTTYTYVGSRLTKAEDSLTSTTFEYDDFGNVIKSKQIVTGTAVLPPTPDLPGLPATCGAFNVDPGVTRYCYDEFERLVAAKGPGLADPAVYDYDGFDRRDTKTTKSATGDARRDMAYIGTSRSLSREQDADGTTRYYDYDSSGRRLGQGTANAGTTNPSDFRTYGVDANGSVERVEGQDGSVDPGVGVAKDVYAYDPYGELDTPENLLGSHAKDNPFRYQGFYYDSGVKAYDMQARIYRPDIGRFLSADQFESSTGDFNLQADPLTQNRYVFGGANPINNIEFDGHCSDVCQAGGYDPASSRNPAPDRQRIPRNQGTSLTGERGLSPSVRRDYVRSRPLARLLGAPIFAPLRAGLVSVAPRADRSESDAWLNLVGADLCHGFGVCGLIGDPASATYQDQAALASSPLGQAILIVLPGPGGGKAKAVEEAAGSTGIVAFVRRLIGYSDTKATNAGTSAGRATRFVTTPRGTTFDIPKGWVGREADSGNGIIYQRPGAPGNADSIRIMEPTTKNPRGYFRYYNEHGQPLSVGGKPGPERLTHHHEDYLGPLGGWPK